MMANGGGALGFFYESQKSIDLVNLEQKKEVALKAVPSELAPVKPEARILVLYTGGTIGMRVNPNGVYAPEADYLVGMLKKLPMFHDEEFGNRLKGTEYEKYLVMPISREGRRIFYLVVEYTPLMDSSNMTMEDWGKIATDIKEEYDNYDGFVVLHGTDTMAYTASALSFICENLGKPIILTGSQIPIFEIRSDGRDNFLSSLIVAGHYYIPEVLICFDNKVFRGNRCMKNDSGSFAAFVSPNLPPLATLEININVDWAAVFRCTNTEKFVIQTKMCENVGLLRIFPGITSQTVRAFLTPPMQGVVLQTYGAGNAPDNRPDLLKIFQEATNWGVLIVNITQCTRGSVQASYNTGKTLVDAGVIPGGDMTPEASLAKLSYVLSKDNWNFQKKRKMIKRNLRGEMTVVTKEEISIMDLEIIDSVAKTLCLSSRDEIVKLRDALYPNLLCAAAKIGDVPALEKLRQTGANLSAQNQDGRTALHIASREGHWSVVQYLLNHGTSIHTRDHHGHTPLIDAVQGQHLRIIKILVKTGGTLILHPSRLAMELCSSAAQNDIESLKAWCAAGIDVNSADYDNRTALHVAVTKKNKEAYEFLLDSGARWDLPDSFGNTAISIAGDQGDEELETLMRSRYLYPPVHTISPPDSPS
ncbi:hypothetical protein ScPMuIL_014536 [Solemya velum]